MRRSLAVLASLAVLVLAVAACRNGAESPENPADPLTGQQTEESEPLAPLTGLPVEDETVLDRPALAAKVDNNVRARPQEGLGKADVRVTEVVEGGLTRFIAIFHSRDPGRIGPLRSARPVDTRLLPAFSPLFAFSGAAQSTWDVLRESPLAMVADDIPEQRERAGFTRDENRPRPHNLFVSAERLWNLREAKELSVPEQAWSFDPEPPEGGREATAMSMAYSHSDEAAWEWNDGQDRWVRSIRGEPHVAADGRRLGAKNVVVVRTSDARAHNVLGHGEAVLFRDGRAYQAQWRKATADTHFGFVAPDGESLALDPGSTWIELVPQAGRLEVAYASDDG